MPEPEYFYKTAYFKSSNIVLSPMAEKIIFFQMLIIYSMIKIKDFLNWRYILETLKHVCEFFLTSHGVHFPQRIVESEGLKNYA